MTAAYRFRGLGWFLSGVIVVLGFYLVSLQVAAERKKVDDVNRAIAAAKRELRALETEFNTRANLAQLERWNGDVLALTAPTADQFVSDEAALAQVNFNRGSDTKVASVAYVVPTAPPAPALQTAAVQTAAATPEAAPAVAVATVQAAPAVVRVAAVTTTSATPGMASAPRPAIGRTVINRVATAAGTPAARNVAVVRNTRRTQAVAMLDRSLLSDSMIGDLVDGARAEAGGLR